MFKQILDYCDDALLIYDASNYSNFYVVKSPVISLQRIHLLLHLVKTSLAKYIGIQPS